MKLFRTKYIFKLTILLALFLCLASIYAQDNDIPAKRGMFPYSIVDLRNSIYSINNLKSNDDTIKFRISNCIVDRATNLPSQFYWKYNLGNNTKYLYSKSSNRTIDSTQIQFIQENGNIYHYFCQNDFLYVFRLDSNGRNTIKSININGEITDTLRCMSPRIIGSSDSGVFIKSQKNIGINSELLLAGQIYELKQGKISEVNTSFLNSKFKHNDIIKDSNNIMDFTAYLSNNFLGWYCNTFFTDNHRKFKIQIAPDTPSKTDQTFYFYNFNLFYKKEQSYSIHVGMDVPRYGSFFYIYKLDTLDNSECIYDSESLQCDVTGFNDFIVFDNYLIISAELSEESPVLNHDEPLNGANTIFIYDYVNKKYVDKPFRIENDPLTELNWQY